MKTILYIHQSADLYGSDKTLLYLVELIKDKVNPIVIVPEEGPLTEEFTKINIEFHILPVIKISRQLFKSIKVLLLPFQVFTAIYRLRKKLGKRKIDIIHSNTLAVFLGAFYGKIFNIKHIWHVHEIIQRPKIIAEMYPFLVNRLSDFIVFNSKASAEHLYIKNPKLRSKSKIIYNGLDRNEPFLSVEEKNKLRESLLKTIDKSSILIGLVGRINKIKGQRLLLNVFECLTKKGHHDIYLLFIGSTIKSQMYLLEELKTEILNKKLQNIVTIIDFQKDLWKFYDCIDILVVPTIVPETFGLVALEGMLSKKPVIASNHGGLIEIIEHNKTGLLIDPGNESELESAIENLIGNQQLIISFGKEGETKAKKEFSLTNYITNFKDLYSSF